MQASLWKQRGIANKHLIWLLVILVALLATAGAVFRSKANKEPAVEQKPAITLEFAPNDIAVAQMRELPLLIPLIGNLQPFNQTLVRAKVPGEIKQIFVREGAAVAKGQVLAALDTYDLQARLDEKIANLEGARAQLVLAEKNQQNNQFLLKQKFISQNAYDNTQSSLLVNQATLKSLQAQVDLARNALNDAVVKAPMEGLIAKRHVQPGEKVSQDMPLFAIVDLSRMELQAPIPANEIANVRLGQEVSIRVDGHDKTEYKGRVERINPVSDSGSRSITAYVSVANPEHTLKGGMFATGLLRLSNTPPVLAVPLSAIRSENGHSHVVALENGKLAMHPVELGQTSEQEGLVEVRSGLKVNAQVVTGRMDGLKPGSPAILKTEPSAASSPDAIKG